MTIDYKDSKRIVALLISQGYDGAGGVTNIAGGGGGAGVAANGMNGGNGSQNDITGTNLYYAGGGGGAADGFSTGGTGGQGGGGRGGDNNTGSIGGTDGLGGGAGGGGNTTNDGTGGSGVVILRFTTSGNGYSQAGGVVTTSGSDTIITWTATSGTRTFTPTSSFNVRYLVVAGGGGSMENWGHAGGAGAGGMLEGTGKEVTAQAYTIVGAGGANGGGSGMPSQGGNSVFSDITATGGGYGGNWYSGSTNTGGNGGSGGGGQSGGSNYAGGTGTSESKPTNVQDNSILIEKDTARRYWRTPALTPTYTPDLSSSSGWALTNGGGTLSIANNEITISAN